MDSEELLAQLADIRLPEPIGWWPLAPGWWVVIVLLLIASGFAMRSYKQIRDRKRLLSFALAELERGLDEGSDQENVLTLVNRVNTVLRRVALYHFPHASVASLSGAQWAEFLRDNSTQPLEPALFDGLASGRFQRTASIDTAALEQFARAWITEQYSRPSVASIREVRA